MKFICQKKEKNSLMLTRKKISIIYELSYIQSHNLKGRKHYWGFHSRDAVYLTNADIAKDKQMQFSRLHTKSFLELLLVPVSALSSFIMKCVYLSNLVFTVTCHLGYTGHFPSRRIGFSMRQ